MKEIRPAFAFLLFTMVFTIACTPIFAQQVVPAKPEHCATMQRLELKLGKNPLLRSKFKQQLEDFNRKTAAKALRPLVADAVTGIVGGSYTIPVVFHLVLTDQLLVTDEQVLSQLNILNSTFAASAADSASIPDHFKHLVGRSGIQFCLAQRTPDGEPSTGIERANTSVGLFLSSDDGVKYRGKGGTGTWDPTRYLNIWVCKLGDLLGYATFPGDGQLEEEGVVIDYRSLPGGSYASYNGGKTLTHEIGHYFNLYHIWGDDNGACTGSDYVDDTPNQASSSSGCSSGIKTDNCSTGGNGILYQDYMDYSYDNCLLMFTSQQVERMETALLTYRSSLVSSDACAPVVTKATDAQLKSIGSPGPRICTGSFTPAITLSNKGWDTLRSLVISMVIDNAAPLSFTWTGNLASLEASTIQLITQTIAAGNHAIKIYVSRPNGVNDENTANDTLSLAFQYYLPVSAVKEGFEGSIFPQEGWDIVNADRSVTWEKVTGVSRTGNGSVMMKNFGYNNSGQQDYLRLPQLELRNIDSAYLSFDLAAATNTAISTPFHNWDTLEVLASKDCGASYNILYKKWGSSLVTRSTETTSSFQPGPNEWRKDSVNLTPYINGGPVMIAFRNTSGSGNNIYLDNINLRSQIILPNLKASGLLVTPNPATNQVAVQFYPNPVNLRSIQLYNMLGQKLAEISIGGGQASTAYYFDLSRWAAGTYLVRINFADRSITRKIIKN